jgi:hypothetical protein
MHRLPAIEGAVANVFPRPRTAIVQAAAMLPHDNTTLYCDGF